ncbi:MAG: M23 family metallopeptidase [Bacteroidales bacterium]|nr:M23 family metallopeptidase [Bacteroidales bacterium]
MPKNKYRFNHETLSFIKVRPSLKEKFFKGITYLMATIVITIVYYSIYTSFFDTPKERGLKRERKELLSQFDTLNRKYNRVEAVLKDIQQRDANIYRTIFEAEPIPLSIRSAGIGGTDRYSELEDLSNSELVVEATKKLSALSKQVDVQKKSFDEIFELAKNKETMVRCIPNIQPISNKDLTRVASPFGVRIHPFYKVLKMHSGMDFTAPTGTEVYATGDGVVFDIDRSKRGYGNTVIIDHGFGYKTLYAHLSEILVRPGNKIRRGTVVGLVGSTGMSLAPHLHYEVRLNDNPIDPINFYFNDLTPAEYSKLIEISSQPTQSFD